MITEGATGEPISAVLDRLRSDFYPDRSGSHPVATDFGTPLCRQMNTRTIISRTFISPSAPVFARTNALGAGVFERSSVKQCRKARIIAINYR